MIRRQIEQRIQTATLAILPDADAASVLIRPCQDSKFGDYQCNALMALAKVRKLNPRQLATDVLAKLDVAEWCERVEIAGAGFLNFHLSKAAIATALQSAARDEHRFFRKTDHPRTIVIDFSSPNIAKPMHIGHIRSTILGDCLARTLRLLGHRVITDNHIGDWGTQFGKLIVGWKTDLNRTALGTDAIAEMERLYKLVNAQCDADPIVIESARKELVKLQEGDADNLSIWREMIALSQNQFDTIYGRLGVRFDHTYGESFYNPRLKSVVEDLRASDIVRESEGAQVVFFDDIPSLKDHPAIVQKRDGGANYTTTDLATIEFRLRTWGPDEVVYVTDGRQQLHFQQLFSIFRRWHSNTQMRLAHVWFGSILGDDGKPFKTRSGETVKLADLLDEAEERALKAVQEKNPDLPQETQREIARIVGLGAVKYADLLPNRQSDYVFSWDKMLALQGNTAPYLLYAYTRVQSIFRKVEFVRSQTSSLQLAAPEELALARHLLNYGMVIESVAEEYRPNYLCNYLYELAGHFARFYEGCPVLKASESERDSRLLLCHLTAHVLRQGLELLGIEVVDQM